MLVMEAIALIRREHTSSKGKTIRETARALKVSRNTVRKALRSGGPHWSRKSTDRKSMFLPLGGSD